MYKANTIFSDFPEYFFFTLPLWMHFKIDQYNRIFFCFKICSVKQTDVVFFTGRPVGNRLSYSLCNSLLLQLVPNKIFVSDGYQGFWRWKGHQISIGFLPYASSGSLIYAQLVPCNANKPKLSLQKCLLLHLVLTCTTGFLSISIFAFYLRATPSVYCSPNEAEEPISGTRRWRAGKHRNFRKTKLVWRKPTNCCKTEKGR